MSLKLNRRDSIEDLVLGHIAKERAEEEVEMISHEEMLRKLLP